jgi:hypothetical protein
MRAVGDAGSGAIFAGASAGVNTNVRKGGPLVHAATIKSKGKHEALCPFIASPS